VHHEIPTAEFVMRTPGVAEWAMKEWQEGRGGPMANGTTGTSFFAHTGPLPLPLPLPSTSTATLNPTLAHIYATLALPTEADYQLTFASSGVSPYPDAAHPSSNFLTHDDPGHYAGGIAVLTHALSRGSVHTVSPDVAVHPVVDPRYLSDEAGVDLALLVEGLLRFQDIVETEPMAGLFVDAAGDAEEKEKEEDEKDSKGDSEAPVPKPHHKLIQPAFHIQGRLTREKAIPLVRAAAFSSFHPVGTCAMLPRAQGGVVDAQLRVYGTRGLRVVDASVFPVNVRGNIISSVYAVAERAADGLRGGAW
jgi:choline dehydrogenase-like flavoprotein